MGSLWTICTRFLIKWFTMVLLTYKRFLIKWFTMVLTSIVWSWSCTTTRLCFIHHGVYVYPIIKFLQGLQTDLQWTFNCAREEAESILWSKSATEANYWNRFSIRVWDASSSLLLILLFKTKYYNVI